MLVIKFDIKIGWGEHDTKRYWSRYEFYKISCETRSVEYIFFETHSEINIFEYHEKKKLSLLWSEFDISVF